jgi:hypothetical protein
MMMMETDVAHLTYVQTELLKVLNRDATGSKLMMATAAALVTTIAWPLCVMEVSVLPAAQ